MREFIIIYLWNGRTMQMTVRGNAMVERTIASLRERFLGLVVPEVA